MISAAVQQALGVSTEPDDKKTDDEIKRYITGRYLCSNQCVWQMLGFRIHEHYPAVETLPIHLEGMSQVIITGDDITDIQNGLESSKLLAFFRLCETDDFAKNLLYIEVPTYFTWGRGVEGNMIWKRRTRQVPELVYGFEVSS